MHASINTQKLSGERARIQQKIHRLHDVFWISTPLQWRSLAVLFKLFIRLLRPLHGRTGPDPVHADMRTQGARAGLRECP